MQVKSAKHMIQSKTKYISSLGTFSNFSKLNVKSLIVMERGCRKSQWNSRICVRAQVKLVYPVWNLSDSSKSLNDRQIKGTWRCQQSDSSFPTHLGKIEVTLLAGYWNPQLRAGSSGDTRTISRELYQLQQGAGGAEPNLFSNCVFEELCGICNEVFFLLQGL